MELKEMYGVQPCGEVSGVKGNTAFELSVESSSRSLRTEGQGRRQMDLSAHCCDLT